MSDYSALPPGSPFRPDDSPFTKVALDTIRYGVETRLGGRISVDVERRPEFIRDELIARLRADFLGKKVAWKEREESGEPAIVAVESVPVGWWDALLLAVGRRLSGRGKPGWLERKARTRTITTELRHVKRVTEATFVCPHHDLPGTAESHVYYLAVSPSSRSEAVRSHADAVARRLGRAIVEATRKDPRFIHMLLDGPEAAAFHEVLNLAHQLDGMER